MNSKVSFGVGVAVGALGVVAAIFAWAFLKLGSDSEKMRQEKLGVAISCEWVEKQARTFIKDRALGIVEAIRKNEMARDDLHLTMTLHVSWIKNQLAPCRLSDAHAMGTNVPLATHLRDITSLFDLLAPYMQLWRYKVPADIPQTQDMLARLEQAQRGLTDGSSGRPQAGAADPKR
jgi:hypothetical protein